MRGTAAAAAGGRADAADSPFLFSFVAFSRGRSSLPPLLLLSPLPLSLYFLFLKRRAFVLLQCYSLTHYSRGRADDLCAPGWNGEKRQLHCTASIRFSRFASRSLTTRLSPNNLCDLNPAFLDLCVNFGLNISFLLDCTNGKMPAFARNCGKILETFANAKTYTYSYVDCNSLKMIQIPEALK